MKVAIVLMKGFDGCGVSRFAVEHQKKLRDLNLTSNQEYVCDIYAYSGNSYLRVKSHKDKDVIFYKDFTSIDFNRYDIFILNSYEKDFNEEDFNYYKSLKCIKVAMMHEILRQNVSRIDHVWDWLEASDIISSFSEEMDFTCDLREKYPDKKYFSFKMAMNNDDMNNLYNNSLLQEKQNHLVYYGRWTTMKNPSRLFELKNLDSSLNLSMLGIERSIGAKFDIFDNPLCEVPLVPQKKDSSKLGGMAWVEKASDFLDYKRDDSKVYVFPPADRDAALEILSKVLFGCSFYRLKEAKAHNLGNRMEYTQIEMSCVCLPIFDLDWRKENYRY